MSSLNKLAILAPSPARAGVVWALVDRFLAGYPRDGGFLGRIAPVVVLHAPGLPAAEVDRRRQDGGLELASTLEAAVDGADGVVMVPTVGSPAPPAGDVETVFGRLRPGGGCFAVGLEAARGEDALRLAALSKARGIRWGAAGMLSVTFRLPEGRPKGTRHHEALIVVQGDDATALEEGVQGLLPELDPALAAEGSVRRYENDAVWRAGATGAWSWDLLAAALSRSSNPQGDAVTDGRTQDLVGLGMVQRLAQHPRAWVTEHVRGGRSAILALDGVVKDVNLATRDPSGRVDSVRLYRPPAPNEAGYHRLAGVIEDFLKGGDLPWPAQRGLGLAAWWQALQEA